MVRGPTAWIPWVDPRIAASSSWTTSTPLLVPVQAARAAEAAKSHHATAVPSSSTIWPGTASRVTPSIVVVGATLAAPNRDASTP